MITVIMLKSITSLRPFTIISLLMCLTVIISNGDLTSHGHKKVISNFPKEKYIDDYLTSLEKIIEFCVKHKLYIDLNFEFGLFLVAVNLKNILEVKADDMPLTLKYRIEQLLVKTDVVNEYFRYMVRKTKKNIAYDEDRKITRLFFNETIWPKYMQRFNTMLLKKTKVYTPEQLERIYGKWENYEANVDDFEKYKPSPDDSDACIALLGEQPTAEGSHIVEFRCKAPQECRDGIERGSDYGYGLTHRVLYLLLSRFARGCSVFSLKEDKSKMDRYCKKAFNEAQFIAANGYKKPDLMMEQIVICGLIGHAQFIQHEWIKNFLKLQTHLGCFTENVDGPASNEMRLKELPDDAWTLQRFTSSIMNGGCNGHTTALAAALLSSAIRYILENNYSY
ncbi:unnamed protein product [Chrysodeixis includens]|uniref:Uncharacterized protein n=1 Tax=Chrysodeixis includens TaxID=689277 RepID=A0A9P0BSW7_CHRIL|nr:unnamed protein product [Chrysodeixis includens]